MGNSQVMQHIPLPGFRRVLQVFPTGNELFPTARPWRAAGAQLLQIRRLLVAMVVMLLPLVWLFLGMCRSGAALIDGGITYFHPVFRRRAGLKTHARIHRFGVARQQTPPA